MFLLPVLDPAAQETNGDDSTGRIRMKRRRLLSRVGPERLQRGLVEVAQVEPALLRDGFHCLEPAHEALPGRAKRILGVHLALARNADEREEQIAELAEELLL